MTELSDDRIEAGDRRRAAIHEAGHFVIACHLGLQGRTAVIWRRDDPSWDENRWIGRMGVDRKRIRWRRGKKQTSIPCRRDYEMFSLAGPIAELVWEYRLRTDLGRLEVLDELCSRMDEAEFMSPSDWDLLGVEPGDPLDRHLRLAIDLFFLLRGELWTHLICEARRLIVESRPLVNYLPSSGYAENPTSATPSNPSKHRLKTSSLRYAEYS